MSNFIAHLEIYPLLKSTWTVNIYSVANRRKEISAFFVRFNRGQHCLGLQAVNPMSFYCLAQH